MTSFDETETTGRQNSANNITENLTSTIKEASDTAKQQATQKLDENRDQTANQLEGIAHAAHAAASSLEEQNHQGLSHYITDLANNVSSLANGLRKKSIDELIGEAQNIARRNPALFIGASIAIGLGIARFAKASSHRSHHESESRNLETGNSTLRESDNNLNSESRSDQNFESSSATEYPAPSGMGRSSPVGNGLSKQSGNGANTIGGSHYE